MIKIVKFGKKIIKIVKFGKKNLFLQVAKYNIMHQLFTMEIIMSTRLVRLEYVEATMADLRPICD